MNDLTITVSGWVATEPRYVVGRNGTSLTSFRVASTNRYFDRTSNAWEDGQTEWFTVRTFRGAALTVLDSIAKGQPILVTGRLRTNTWESEAGSRTDLVIDATAVGHDLTRGIATFRRAVGDASLGADDSPAAGVDVPQDAAEGPEAGVDVPNPELEEETGAEMGDEMGDEMGVDVEAVTVVS